MNNSTFSRPLLVLALFIVHSGLGAQEEDLRQRFALQPLPPVPYPLNNPFNADRFDLGRLLFFDPILSGEKDTACGTCHLPEFGMADGRSLGAGTSGKGLGPTRRLGFSAITGDTVISEPRHTMTIFNVGYNGDESGLPSPRGFMLWDGKDRGLEAQALRPIIVRVELRGDAYPREMAVDSVLARLRSIPEYARLFEQAFPAEADSVDRQLLRLNCAFDHTPLQSVITRSTLGRALAAFERELITADAPYDRYLAGDDQALDEAQKRGLELFHSKAGCVKCHSGPLLTDSSFRVQGVEQIGPGRGSATTNTGTPQPTGRDEGRFLNSGNRKDIGAFRVVSLRQVEKTAPYMHDGALATLEEVIEFYDRGGGDDIDIARERIDSDLVPLGLDAGEKRDLLTFLKALTDETVKVEIPLRVPSGLTPPGVDESAAEAGLFAAGPAAFKPVPIHLANYPNPYNAETVVAYSLPRAAEVDIRVYNALGQELRRLYRGWRLEGEYRVAWDGRDAAGWQMGSGMYVIAVRAEGRGHLLRTLLLR